MKNRAWLLLLGVAVVAAFWGLGRGDVVTDNEGQRTAPPATMLRTGDFVIPMKGGEPYLVKPPLLYWAIAAVYALAGVSEFTARIPTATTGVALVLCVYLGARRETGNRAAFWGAAALLASPYVLERVRYAELDVPLTLATFLSIVLARRATLSESPPGAWRDCILSGIAFGAAVMLKGPVPFLFLWAGAVAVFVVESANRDALLARGLRLSVAAFVADLVLKSIAGVVPSASEVLSMPIGLAAVLVGWTYLAVRHGSHRARWGYWIVAMLLGSALFLPWGLAVLQRVGWDYLRAMLDNQVVERTHTATEINSGSHWYYGVVVLMTAPWGFLLPFQFSKREWERRNNFYRYCVVMAWLSILVFSLIAGKEYEYILPCIPFLLLATGFHLADLKTEQLSGWMSTWARRWQLIVLVALALALPAAAVYCTVTYSSPTFVLQMWLLALAGLAACALARRSRTFRPTAVLVGTLCALLIYLNARGESNQGDRSPKAIAQLTAEYLRAGYRVEASEIYPAFEFYAGTAVPLEQSVEQLRQKFESADPYLYVTRERRLKGTGLDAYPVLAGPIAFKELMLIANRDLPRP